MRFKFVFSTTLTFDEGIYSPPEDACIKKLNDQFVGRNFQSCLILKISKILEIGPGLINHHSSGSVNRSVTFEVEALIYLPNEMIMCNILQRKENGVIVGIGENAAITLQIDKGCNFNVGDSMPVIVKKTGYTPLVDKITVFAIPFVPQAHELFVYQIEKSQRSSEPYKFDIKELQEQVHEELKKAEKSKDEKVYSWINAQLSMSTKIDSENKRLEWNSSDLVGKKLIIPRSPADPHLILVDEVPSDYTVIYMSENQFRVKYYLNILILLRSTEMLLKLTPTTDSLASGKYKEMWTIYFKLKKEMLSKIEK